MGGNLYRVEGIIYGVGGHIGSTYRGGAPIYRGTPFKGAPNIFYRRGPYRGGIL